MVITTCNLILVGFSMSLVCHNETDRLCLYLLTHPSIGSKDGPQVCIQRIVMGVRAGSVAECLLSTGA